MKSRTRLTLRPRKYSFRRKLVVGLFFLAIVFLFFKGTLWLKNAIFAKEKPAEQLVEKTEEISYVDLSKEQEEIYLNILKSKNQIIDVLKNKNSKSDL